MAIPKQYYYTYITSEHNDVSSMKGSPTMNRIWESLLQWFCDKLRKPSRMREQIKLADLERRIKAVEDIVSSFEESLDEATPVQTPSNNTNLNSRAKGHR
ncbi:hypothetical protein ACFX2J_003333 [Malus domestica]